MVTQQCHDEKDDGRFTTAWFYINTNIKDTKDNSILKHMVVDTFVASKNITLKNRSNVEQMVKNLKDQTLKKELQHKLKVSKSKGSLDHHKKQVEQQCGDNKDDGRFQTAWFYINQNVPFDQGDPEPNSSLKRLVVDSFLAAGETSDQQKAAVKALCEGIKNNDSLKNELTAKL